MKKVCISSDWKFTNSINKGNYIDVDLPHDYQITQKRGTGGTFGTGYYPVSNGRYVKYLNLEANKHYILDIDGAYMCTHVDFNETRLGMHPHGYTPFLVDLTPYVFSDITNKLVISTTPLPDSTRWYSGNGIYRDVFLWEGGAVRIEPRDIFISTEKVENGVAFVKIRYEVKSDLDGKANVKFCVKYGEQEVLSITEACDVKKNDVTKKELTVEITDPKLWNIDTPELYKLCTEIEISGEISDVSETVFGIRTVYADINTGLLINGKPIKLRGGCIHHDHGDLGAAAFPAAERRKISILKNAGFNAIRCAHNPPSLALLEACDELGMVVMDEAFDMWCKEKTPNDYHLFFADWYLRDVTYMVLRDRNHPCVFSYSIGNEIYEIDGLGRAGEFSRKLCEEIKKHDDTKFVTSGLQKWFAAGKHQREDIDPEDYKEYLYNNFEILAEDDHKLNKVATAYDQYLDIIGLNYYYTKYEFDFKDHIQKVFWGSETHVTDFYYSWNTVKRLNYVIGDFTWTAYDNIGEVGTGRSNWSRDGVDCTQPLPLGGSTYPWRTCFQGDMDLCGFRRPQSYFRESVFVGNTEPRIFTTHPEHFGEPYTGTRYHWNDVKETWSYPDIYIGRPITAETYTDADKIVWYVNGVQVGESIPVAGIATLETKYEKGEIKAVAYKNGSECSSYTLKTSDKSAVINLNAENSTFKADGRDLCFVEIDLADVSGIPSVTDDKEIMCEISGGELLAFYSGDPKSEYDVLEKRCKTFNGKALAIFKTKVKGPVYLTVYGDGLAGATLKVEAV